jgi:hypothetical protein
MANKIVLTTPSGASGVPGTVIQNISIPPLTTVTADSIPAGNFNIGAKWIYTIMNPTSQKVLTGEVVANHQYENNVRWNRYGLVGDNMPHSVDVTLSGSPGGYIELNITNNHSTETYSANIVRIQLLA